MIATSTIDSPIGRLLLKSDGWSVTGIEIARGATKKNRDRVLLQCEKELGEYFSGKRTNFSVPVEPQGTLFQKAVWAEMGKVGFGSTTTYAEIAKKIHRPKAVRAVGAACGKNPILLMVPCHRVTASGGGLGGFSAGTTKKKLLLSHEKKSKKE